MSLLYLSNNTKYYRATILNARTLGSSGSLLAALSAISQKFKNLKYNFWNFRSFCSELHAVVTTSFFIWFLNHTQKVHLIILVQTMLILAA